MLNQAQRDWLRDVLGVDARKLSAGTTAGMPQADAGPIAGRGATTSAMRGPVSSSPDEPVARVLNTITVYPENAWIVGGGEALDFTATGDYSDGTSEVLTAVVEWRSLPPGLVSIDKNGRAVAQAGQGPGPAKLTASYERLPGSAEVIASLAATVTVVTLEGIQIQPINPSMTGGSRLQFKVLGQYSDGPPRELPRVAWSTDRDDIVTIDGSGWVSAKKVMGKAEIAAKYERFSTATGVNVMTPILKELRIEPAHPLPLTGEQQFTATGLYTVGEPQDETKAVEWRSSREDILSVDDTVQRRGLAVPLKAGVARLTATERNSGATAFIDVTAAPPDAPVLQLIEILPPVSLLVGTRKLKAMGRYSSGPDQDITDQVTWRTSADDVVAIDQHGTATAQSKSGAATVSATAHDRVGEIIVTVRAPLLDSISIYADVPPVPSKRQNFQATGEFTDGTSHQMAGKVLWTSSDSSVISIDRKTGVASVKSTGSATITAEYAGKPNAGRPVVGWTNIVVAPPAPPGPLTSGAVTTLIQNLVYLADPRFYRATGKPGPPRLKTAGEPSVDALLGQAADVVRLWADPKTLPAALELWRGLSSRLAGLLDQAQDPKKLGFTPAALKPARDAMAKIADYLSIQESDLRLDDAVKESPTPELSKELDERELKKLEPALKAWKKATHSGGRFGALGEMRKLSEALDIYFSTPDPIEKLHAFQHAHMLEEASTLPDLAAFLIHNCVTGGSAVTEAGIEIAEAAAHAGNPAAKAAVASLERRLILVKAVGGAVALLDLALGTIKLISGIEEGNWHDIAEGGATLAMGSVGLGEAAGYLAADSTAFATTGIVVTWAVFDVILMAGEQARWAKKMKEMTAFKSLVADARKLIPIGKRMSAAVELMNDAQTATDDVNAGNYERYKQYAEESAIKLGKGLRQLLDKHIKRQDPGAVGGYPELVEPVAPMLKEAYDGIDYKEPRTMVTAFDATVTAIQIMLTAEAAKNKE